MKVKFKSSGKVAVATRLQGVTAGRGILALGAIAAMLSAGAPALAQSSATSSDAQGEYVRGRVLVMARAGLADAEVGKIAGAHGGRARAIGRSGIFIIDLPPQASETAVLQRLAHNPHLKFAELDRKVKPALAVNDPYAGSEWHVSKIGASSAWDTTQGLGVTVAILDSGVDASHPDLVGQLLLGWNFVDNNSDTTDVYGHGTAVAGTVAAATNNGVGVAGISGRSKILPVRVSDSTGWATYSALAEGITYAADKGARVANMSFIGTMQSSSVISAAQYMKSKNGLVFASAGNSGVQENYVTTTSMITVSATNSSDQLASFSSWGGFVALSAPGESIYTTQRGGTYWSCWGTSFSSPVAAAVGALVMAAKPTLSSAQVESILYSTATDLGASGRDSYFGHGRVNAGAAVSAAIGTTAIVPADAQAPTVAIASPGPSSTVLGLVPVNVSATDNIGVSKVELHVNGTLLATDTTAPFEFSWNSALVANGMASLVATAYDAAGNKTASAPLALNVVNASVALDTTPPTLAISNPVPGSIVGRNVTISATSTDDSGSAGITLTLMIDGATVRTATGGSLQHDWNTRKVRAGQHTITVVARDARGNSTTATVSVYK